MSGFTITFRTSKRLRFRLLNADSHDHAIKAVRAEFPTASIVSVRWHREPHQFVVAQVVANA